MDRYKGMEIFIGMFCIIMICLSLSGCTIIWSDSVFVGTLFKTVDANDLDIIAEPNYIWIGSGKSRTENDKIKVISTVGIIESGAEE